jgi:hypothetical protein
MKRSLAIAGLAAVAMLAASPGAIHAQDSFLSRMNPFRLFQKPTAGSTPSTAPATGASPAGSYGMPGPEWHAEPQSASGQMPGLRGNGEAFGPGGRYAGNGSPGSDATRPRFERRDLGSADNENRFARTADAQAGGRAGSHAIPAVRRFLDASGKRSTIA